MRGVLDGAAQTLPTVPHLATDGGMGAALGARNADLLPLVSPRVYAGGDAAQQRERSDTMIHEARYYRPRQGQIKRHLFADGGDDSICGHVERTSCIAARPSGWIAACQVCHRRRSPAWVMAQRARRGEW